MSNLEQLVYGDYKRFIFAMYEAKRANGTLSQLLRHPTAANIRTQCLIVYKQGLNPKDAGCLTAFFETVPDGSTFLRVIERFPRDRFTPLVNFLRNPNIETDRTNLELLAWLIDFKPRPHEVGMRVDVEEIKRTIEREQLLGTSNTGRESPSGPDEDIDKDKADSGSKNRPSSFQWTKYLLFGVLGIGVILSVYFLVSLQEKSTVKDGACMFWAADHYESIPCQTMGDTLVVPLDSLRLANFRKITRPDTITRYSIGKLWYILIDGGIEFYTMGGRHPMERKKKLRPVSNTIYENRIMPLKSSPPLD